MHEPLIGEAFDNGPSLFRLLSTVRNRRVAKGWSLDSGREERHPVTGRRMAQVRGPLEWVAPHEPQPLSELEEALLCWAACGPNGIVVWDMLFANGFNQMGELAGRTSPTPHNTRTTEIVVINDDGAHVYRPQPDVSRTVIFAGGPDEQLDAILDWYRSGRIRILDHRPDFDWAMWQEGAPNAPLSGAVQFNLNRPGSTWFLPIADAGQLMVTLLDFMSTGHKYVIDDFNGGRPAGLDPWIEPGRLEIGVPLSVQEQTILQAETYPSGALTQNVRLAAEALGLGAWTVSGYNRDVLLGINPAITTGLGFAWAPPNPLAPLATGRSKCIGIEGVKEATFVPSPRYPSARDLVDHWRDERYGTGGWADTSAEGLLSRGGGPFKAGVVEMIHRLPGSEYPDWVWDATTAYIEYCVDTFGQWPVTYNPMQAHWGPIVHHVEPDFYDLHYRDGYVTAAIRGHDSRWHENTRDSAGGER